MMDPLVDERSGRFSNACTGQQAVRYGERQRPEHRSI